jgi:hypothetical protein
MTPQTVRIVIGMCCLTMWSCAWGDTAMPYPVKDAPIKEAPIAAGPKDIAWLDNTHVVFDGAMGGEGSPDHESPFTNKGAYVWDLDRGTATREPRFDRADPPICSRGPYLSYIEHSEDLKSAKRRAFENGQEVILPEPGKFWFNPISCRTYTTKPWWVMEGRWTVPLLEEHGYIELGGKPQDLTTNFPLFYFRPGAADPLPLGLWKQQVNSTVRYAPFLDAYLLMGHSSSQPAPLWLLHPSGTVEQIFSPEGHAWATQSGWSWVELTKRGPVVVSLRPRSKRQAADAGLYLWAGGVLTRVAEGYFTSRAVSPDGCKLAVIKSRPERPLPPAELWRLQIIDLCNGGTHVH